MPELPPLIQRVIADVSNHAKGLATARADMEGTGKSAGGMSDVVKNAMSKLGDSTGGVGKAFKALGVDAGDMGGVMKFAVAGGAIAAGVAIADFGLKSVKAFADATAQVRQFQRVAGTTAEESSKLVFASRQLGIDADTTSAAMFRLSKNIATHADTLRADGVQIAVNKQGHTDLIGTLFNVSDAYHRTQDQVQKNKIVFDAFGRSGAALIPILQRGREGMKDLFAEASKDHQLFSSTDLENGRQFTLATRALGEAFKGVEIEVGQALIPRVTQLVGVMTDLVHTGDQIKGFKLPGADSSVAEHLLRQVNVLADIGNFAEIAHGHYKNFFQGIGEGIPVLGMFVHKTHEQSEAQKHAADTAKLVADASKDEELALGILTKARSDAGQAALQSLVAYGSLTQAQVDQVTAMHHNKDGTKDYIAALKDLDPAAAQVAQDTALINAGLDTQHTRFQLNKDEAGLYKEQFDELVQPTMSADEAQRKFGNTLSEMTSWYRKAATEAKAYQGAVSDIVDPTLSAREAEIKLQETIEKTNKALATNKGATDLKTQAGRDDQQSVIDLVRAYDTEIDAMIRSGDSTVRVNAERQAELSALDALKAKYPGLTSAINEYEARLKEASSAGEEGKRITDQQKAALEGVITDGAKWTETLIAMGAPTAEVNRARQDEIDKLNGLKAQYPALSGAIDGYIAKLQSIPPSQNTVVTADTSQAMAALQQLADEMHVSMANALAFRAYMQGINISGILGAASHIHFASGGIVDRPTLAWVGEKSHREVIIPMDDSRRAMELAHQSGLMALLSGASGASGGSVAPMSAGPAMSYGGSTVVVHVYPSPGMDEEALAEKVRAKLQGSGRNNVPSSLWGG